MLSFVAVQLGAIGWGASRPPILPSRRLRRRLKLEDQGFSFIYFLFSKFLTNLSYTLARRSGEGVGIDLKVHFGTASGGEAQAYARDTGSSDLCKVLHIEKMGRNFHIFKSLTLKDLLF